LFLGMSFWAKRRTSKSISETLRHCSGWHRTSINKNLKHFLYDVISITAQGLERE
jgi:hypothetical protein